MSQIVTVNNILEPQNRETRHTFAKNKQELLLDIKYDVLENDLVFIKNGLPIDGDFDIVENDIIVVKVVPKGGGGGGGGKDIVRTIALIAVTVAAVYTGGAVLAFTGSQFAAYASMAIVTMAGGLLVNAILPPTLPDFGSIGGSLDNLKNSTTYGWDVGGNSTQQGVPIPKIFGTHKITPPIIGKYVETIGSKQVLNMLFALNDGLITNVKDIRINDQSIENYIGVAYEVRNGGITQALLPTFADTRYDTAVNRKLPSWIDYANTGSFPVTGVIGQIYRDASTNNFYTWNGTTYTLDNDSPFVSVTTSSNTISEFSLGLVMPRGLYYANDSGGISSYYVKVIMEYSENGVDWIYFGDKTTVTGYSSTWRTYTDESGSYYQNENTLEISNILPSGSILIQQGNIIQGARYGVPYTYTYDYQTITDATTSTLRKTYKVSNLTPKEYQVRIRLAEVPATGSRYGSDVYFEFLQEGVSDDFTYPSTALLAIRAYATDQLSGGLPTVTCVATSGLTETDANGNANPADVCRQMLLDCGVSPDEITSSFDVFKSHCTNMGYTCNIVFDSSLTLRKALDTVSTLGRATIMQYGTFYEAIMDKAGILPVDSFMFGMGNILKDTFKQSFLPIEGRANIIEITYYDKDNDYERTVIEVSNANYDAVTEVNRTSVNLIGCVSRTMAKKHAQYLLNCNRLLTETIEFEADIDSFVCRENDIVYVAHDLPQYGYSGRIVSCTETEVVLDREIEMVAGKTYVIQLKNKLNETTEHIVTNTESVTKTLTFQTPLVTPYEKYDLYSFGEMGIASKLFRIIKIGTGSDMTRVFSALEYNEDVYSDEAALNPDVVSSLGLSNFRITEYLKRGAGVLDTIVDLAWTGASLWYEVGYKKTTEVGYAIQKVYSSTAQINGLADNTWYDFYIQDSKGARLSKQYKVNGKTGLLPDNVQNILAYYQNSQVIMQWDEVFDARGLIDYEIRKGEIWEAGLSLGFTSSPNYIVSSNGTYMVKARYFDVSGVALLSKNEAQILVQNAVVPSNVVAEIDEYATGFIGTKTNMLVNQDGYLQTKPALTISQWPLISTMPNIAWYGGAVLSASYEIPTSHIVDVGTAQKVRIWVEYDIAGINILDKISYRGLISTWPSISGISSDYNMQLQIQIAQNDGIFGSWQNFYAGDYIGRKFNIRALFSTTNGDISIIVRAAKIFIDMEDKIQDNGSVPVTIPTGGDTITFPIPFQVSPSVQCTIINSQDGDEYKISNITSTTFDVEIFNGGISVGRDICWLAKAY